jgi:REP element-mobilizing transposase RayT
MADKPKKFGWGGKRPGAGRKPKGPISSEPHRKRIAFVDKPVHVALRACDDLVPLRRREVFDAIRIALVASIRDNCRVVGVSIQPTHLHLLVEADNRMALARGMQSFQISAARSINREVSKKRAKPRSGPVFADRYRPRVLGTAREVRDCIKLMLDDWRPDGVDPLNVWRPKTTLLRDAWRPQE